jgi:hypothetical protein
LKVSHCGAEELNIAIHAVELRHELANHVLNGISAAFEVDYGHGLQDGVHWFVPILVHSPNLI